jgi:hypothetical protein
MKKECERTRRALPDYLRGHVFKMTRIRIERHLERCVVCRSEFEALRRTEETRQILKDINAPESVVGRVKEGVSSIRRLKTVIYRPLWMAGLVLIAAAVYYYIVTPRQLDIEIERIVKTEPTVSAPTTSVPAVAANAPVTPRGSKKLVPPHAAATPPAPERLVVTITADNDKAAVRRINEIMHGHSQLQQLKFSDSAREVGGSLTANELVIFFNRIRSVAKVSYSRKRFQSFPASEPIPFMMKLVIVPGRSEEPGSIAQPVQKPAEAPAGGTMPAASRAVPPQTPGEARSEAAVPASPETAPSHSTMQ